MPIEKLREEFYKLYGDGSGANGASVADWWLSKILEREKELKEIYIITEWTNFGIIELFYSLREKLALEKFKEIVAEKIKQAKKDETFVKKEDLERAIPNGHIETIKNDEFNKDELYSATVSEWYKSSYEYDEWDIGGSTFKLIKRPLLDIDEKSK